MKRYSGKLPMAAGPCQRISHLTFDGKNYYGTLSGACMVVQLNACGQVERRIATCRAYDCLCYDWCEDCFWASSAAGQTMLYQLDENWNEIDAVAVKHPDAQGRITAIASDPCTGQLLVGFGNLVLRFLPDTGAAEVVCRPGRGCVLSVVKGCQCCIVMLLQRQKYRFVVYNSRFESVDSWDYGGTAVPMNLVFQPQWWFSGRHCVGLFVWQNVQYPYLCQMALPLSCRPAERCTGCCARCRPAPCPADCTNVMESIARVENAIAHVLHAEGEKLQKVLAQTEELDQILCVNDHVRQTLVQATHLEQVLYEKLRLAAACGSCPDAKEAAHDAACVQSL